MGELTAVIAANVVRFRERLGLTQAAAARAAGVERAMWNRIERAGKVGSLATLVKVAKALKVEPWELLKPT